MGENVANWDKAFVMIDVSHKSDKYWELSDWLKEKGFEFTDVNFGEDN